MTLLVDDRNSEPGEPDAIGGAWGAVPWRTIAATIASVSAVALLILIVVSALRIVALVVVAGFLAVVLNPLVRRVEGRVRGRRGLATAFVLFTTLAAAVGLLTIFTVPVRAELTRAITDLPGTASAAVEGRGPIGRTIGRLHLETIVRDNKDSLDRAVERLQSSSLGIARTIVVGFLTAVTIFVLTFLFLSQSKALATAALSFIPSDRRRTVARVADEAAAAISGYMIGNLIISVVAGASAFAVLLALRVPSAIVLALWVAFADLIPLVGATIGAVVAVLAAFLHSPTAGIVALVFFVVYQQFENSVLQVQVMARTVHVNPLVVLLSVLVGVELFGFLGALLAIPVAGAIQVVGKAVARERRRRRLVLDQGVRE
jgi:predicted PurR-regulated permease PerM